MTTRFRNYINGRRTASPDGKFFEQRNPANLQEVTGLWPLSTREDVRTAIDAAQTAFGEWSRLSIHARAAFFKKVLEKMSSHKEEFARILTIENGKTLAESRTEIDSAIMEMEFQIHEGIRLFGQTIPSAHDGVFAYSTHQPLGVVSIISPWNFPFNVPGRKITPALMAGNTCVFKPASLTPQTGEKFVELFVEADFPPGVINFITGSGSGVGEEMVTNPAIKAISFTGSTSVGRAINEKAAKIMAKTQLEMGGKNPLVVLDDANLDDAAKAAKTAAFACAGQWCTSTSRAIVTKKVIAEFSERLVEQIKQIVLGNGLDSSATMGPVCGTQQRDTILEYINVGKKEGAELLRGGKALAGESGSGCFIEPTVFMKVTNDMTIAQHEIFGPVLSIIEAENLEDAIDKANQVDFGLSSSIYTNDLEQAFIFLERTNVGLTHVNLMTALKEPQLSFGGVKASGFGLPEAGRTGIEFFTEHKVAYIKYR